MIELNKIYNMDCLEGMKRIPDKSIDMVLCDLPYGITDCGWDSVINLKILWEAYKRIIKHNTAIVLTASQPFTSILINNSIKDFKYLWVWDKGRGSNFQNAKYQPMKSHEDICVFYKKRPTYNPQYWYSSPYDTKEGNRKNIIQGLEKGGKVATIRTKSASDGKRYPLSIIKFARDKIRIHPTQKPVALFEYLIKTYSNEGQIVLDNCMGSGTTAIACINTKRNYIGFEKDKNYFDIANKRISEHKA